MRSSNRCDMYMCRLRHINDSVLSSLKMEGISFPLHPFYLHKKRTSTQGRYMRQYILTVDMRPENVLILSFSLHQQHFNINVWPHLLEKLCNALAFCHKG
jgi:hypothetical protein